MSLWINQAPHAWRQSTRPPSRYAATVGNAGTSRPWRPAEWRADRAGVRNVHFGTCCCWPRARPAVAYLLDFMAQFELAALFLDDASQRGLRSKLRRAQQQQHFATYTARISATTISSSRQVMTMLSTLKPLPGRKFSLSHQHNHRHALRFTGGGCGCSFFCSGDLLRRRIWGKSSPVGGRCKADGNVVIMDGSIASVAAQ